MKRLVVIPRVERPARVESPSPSGLTERRRSQRRLGLARRTGATRRDALFALIEAGQERRRGSDRRRAQQRRKGYDRRIGLGRRLDLSDWDL